MIPAAAADGGTKGAFSGLINEELFFLFTFGKNAAIIPPN